MSVVHPHDRFVRRSMKRREVSIPLLRMHLPAEVVEILDFETMTLASESYIDERFRETQSDLVFSMNHQKTGDPLYIYLLFEHKSEVDRELPWSLLYRSVLIMADQRRATGKTSVVVSLTLYHGHGPWTGPLNLSDMIDAPSELLKFAPSMEMILVDLSAIPDESLEDQAWLTVFHIVLKHIRGGKMAHVLNTLLPDILAIRRQKHGLSFLGDVYRYILEAGSEENIGEVVETAVESLPKEVATDMRTMADVLRDEVREEMREEVRAAQAAREKAREEASAAQAAQEKAREEARAAQEKAREEARAAQEKAREEARAAQEKAREEVRATQEKAQEKSRRNLERIVFNFMDLGVEDEVIVKATGLEPGVLAEMKAHRKRA